MKPGNIELESLILKRVTDWLPDQSILNNTFSKFSCRMNRIFFLLMFCFFLNLLTFGQGKMHKASEHHIGILDFFNNHPFKNENGKITHPSPNTNGLLNSKNGWYEEQGIKVKGLVESAALQVDWWLLFNEPTEQYEFQWLSSGKYDIQFTDSKGKLISTAITKSQLEKYPDLLKRFKALQPTDMQFEIKWRIGDQTKANNDAFQKKYKLMGSIGSTLPHVKAEFITPVKNSLLFEPSGIKPFASPSIRPGKGKAFLGVATTYSDEKLRQVFEYWKISEGHVVNSFKVIKQNWPVQEMKTIAEKFLRYEKGEEDPTPKEKVAAANEKNKNTPAYGKNDFWGDAMEEENQELVKFWENDKQGFKNTSGKVIIPAKLFAPQYFKESKLIIDYERDPSISQYVPFYKNVRVYNIKGVQIFHIANVFCEPLRYTDSSGAFMWTLKYLLIEQNKTAFVIDIVPGKRIFEININNNRKYHSIFAGPGFQSCNNVSNCINNFCFSLRQNKERDENKGVELYKQEYYSIRSNGTIQLICTGSVRYFNEQ